MTCTASLPVSNSTVVKLPENTKRGRKPSPDSLIFKTVGLTPEQWQWLELWFPSSSPTSQLRELLIELLIFGLLALPLLVMLGKLAVLFD